MSEHGIPTRAEVVAKHVWRQQDHYTIAYTAYCCCGWSQKTVATHKSERTLWSEHVSAAWRDARTISTRERLRSLPAHAVIVECEPNPCTWQKDLQGYWQLPGIKRRFEARDVHLPARVVWLPGEDDNA